MKSPLAILDFGAGWKAVHALGLRSLGYDVTAHDFGRNFDPAIHDRDALTRHYDVVYASNVLNVHITIRALRLTLAQIALATHPDGSAVVNYPATPRKMPNLTVRHIDHYLGLFFWKVTRLRAVSVPVWHCRQPLQAAHDVADFTGDFTNAEIAAANIRPTGAVGQRPIVPRIIENLLENELCNATTQP